ncbi:MAG: hypothetical protein HKN68_06200 [Saprospiraceae bacterium]|nr:hypothetical protein [Saprospiraceae bacterium]
MTEEYKVLSQEEYETLKNAISWITILVAGADDNIDPQETEWAEKLANIRAFSLDEELKSYYTDVGVDFQERLHKMIADMPDDKDERAEILTKELSKLNPILAKLETSVGALLYESFTSFAKHVAKASGGFLRFFSISAEEKKVIQLNMIDPIEYHPDV